MNYSLLKLKFHTAVHFGESDTAQSLYSSGDHFRADTLFSALCHTALACSGETGLDLFLNWVQSGALLFSDSMPWSGETLYLPKPMAASEQTKEVSSSDRKAMKKLRWIPAEAMPLFWGSIRGERNFEAKEYRKTFGKAVETAKVQVGGDPYPVGTYWFAEDCGLYVLFGYEEEEIYRKVCRWMEVLGISGIGGKTTSGYGRFSIDDEIFLDEPFDDGTEWLSSAVEKTDGRSLLLSTSLPTEAEMSGSLAGSSFQLVRRGGFVQSGTYADTGRKKRTQFYISAGSVFDSRFSGAVYLVGENGTHPVFRYGKAMFLGVEV